MNNLLNAKNELIDTIVNDAAILSWLQGIYGEAKSFTVIEGQPQVKNISGSEFPVFILELADGDLDAPMIGGTTQDVIGDLFEFSIGWQFHERGELLNQRLELVRLLKDALSGNKKLNNGTNDTVDYCRLKSYQNDKSIFYPEHFMNFIVYVETSIT